MTRKSVKLLREGHFAAEVEVELIDDPEGWGPYLSADDAQKLDSVRMLLRKGDLKSASQFGRVFELMPVSN